MSKTIQLVITPGYLIIANNIIKHKGGGVEILTRDGITFRKHPDLNLMCEQEAESVYAEIQAKNGKTFVLGSLYQAPNTGEIKLIHHIEETVNKINSEKGRKEVILAMDQNTDLLKSESHSATGRFLDAILSLKLWLVITRPTRITQKSATLIENMYIRTNLQHSFDSLILIDDISDHLPTIALLKQIKLSDKTPIEYTSRKLNDAKIK